MNSSNTSTVADDDNSADVDNFAAVGGGVGGAVLLILLIGALCILLWCVVINYRKRKAARYFKSVNFLVTSQGHHSLNHCLTTNIEAIELDSTIKQRNCKCSSMNLAASYVCTQVCTHLVHTSTLNTTFFGKLNTCMYVFCTFNTNHEIFIFAFNSPLYATHTFIAAIIEEWKNQLGMYMIEYSTLTIEDVLGKGQTIKSITLATCIMCVRIYRYVY